MFFSEEQYQKTFANSASVSRGGPKPKQSKVFAAFCHCPGSALGPRQAAGRPSFLEKKQQKTFGQFGFGTPG
jgi:hypothetical protein